MIKSLVTACCSVAMLGMVAFGQTEEAPKEAPKAPASCKCENCSCKDCKCAEGKDCSCKDCKKCECADGKKDCGKKKDCNGCKCK